MVVIQSLFRFRIDKLYEASNSLVQDLILVTLAMDMVVIQSLFCFCLEKSYEATNSLVDLTLCL
jgi:hypothetical protein